MARVIGFTELVVSRLRAPESGAVYYRDPRVRNLWLRVPASGRKVWQFVGRMDGRPTRYTIGAWPGVSVLGAKAAAVKLAGRLAGGENPAEARRRIAEEATFGEVFTLYLDKHAKPHKKSWKYDVDIHDRFLSQWDTWRLSSITKHDVAAKHVGVGKSSGHVRANHALALLSMIFNFARGQGFEKPNPCEGVKKFHIASRDRFLNADELRRLFTELEAEGPLWKDYFLLSLLTGARKSNVKAMRWDDIDLDRGVWRIPESESKNREPMLCVLAPAAVEILRRRRVAVKGDFVFPGRRGGHLVSPQKAWERARERAGLSDVRLHDLRRTLAAWQAAQGASLSIIGRGLGHKSLSATAVYARLDLDPVRAAVNKAAEAIIDAGTAPTPKQLQEPKANRTPAQR